MDINSGDIYDIYFPPPDGQGGWRRLENPGQARDVAGLDWEKLDEAFAVMQQQTRNGGLFVVRHGWLAYARWFGKGHPKASPNLASCGKSFTSVAMGILLHEHPEYFPMGLNTRVYNPEYLPAEAFPLKDERKADIKLGELLAFTAGIRGNSPGFVHGKAVELDPIGPDGWPAMTDDIALGLRDYPIRGVMTTTSTLWCAPGEGYSYATASIHIVSIILRRLTGMELQEYLDIKLGRPLGWSRWSFGYKHTEARAHTPGGGGIALQAGDMLRFGYLLLHQGRWQGREVVPAAYVKQATMRSPYNPHYPYSLQFDINDDGHWSGVPKDAFWKRGSGGHVLYVVPSLDLVVWKLGGRDGQYSEQDTGLEPLPEVLRETEERPDWQQTVADGQGARRVLELAVAACL